MGQHRRGEFTTRTADDDATSTYLVISKDFLSAFSSAYLIGKDYVLWSFIDLTVQKVEMFV
jgi:hypothetical protein